MNPLFASECPFCSKMIESMNHSGLQTLMLTHSEDCKKKFFERESQ